MSETIINQDQMKELLSFYSSLLFVEKYKKGYIDIVNNDISNTNDLRLIYRKNERVCATIDSKSIYSMDQKEFESVFWKYIIISKSITIEYQDVSKETAILCETIKTQSEKCGIMCECEETDIYD